MYAWYVPHRKTNPHSASKPVYWLNWVGWTKPQTFLVKYQEKRPEVKKTSDYEKVARHHQGRFTLWSNQGRTAND